MLLPPTKHHQDPQDPQDHGDDGVRVRMWRSAGGATQRGNNLLFVASTGVLTNSSTF